MNTTSNHPVVLELAPLPREQVGPFLLLGVEKTADPATIEQHWADRLKWSRRNLITVPLEEINWARSVLSDMDKRIKADAASFNVDVSDGVLRKLWERYGAGSPTAQRCRPLDVEKDLGHYAPPVEIPDAQKVEASIVIPQVPEEVPAATKILKSFSREPIDPWNLPVAF